MNENTAIEIRPITDTEEYIRGVLKTESIDFEAIRGRFEDPRTIRLLHAAIGMATEAGEILDQVKKHLFYGKPLDWSNLDEEAGDMMWYLGVLADVMEHKDFSKILGKNYHKLAARYGEGFSEDKAMNRDLLTERAILETEVK